jgi:hypothetical protein
MAQSIEEKVPLLIGGHPKSGTTLLVALLDSHPALAVFPEEIVIAHVMRENTVEGRTECMLERSDVVLPGRGLIELPNGQRDYRHIDGEQYLVDLRERIGSALSPKACFLSVFKTWMDHDPALYEELVRYFVEKTPGNEKLYTTYRAWFPQAKFIHIIRDPRDNYTSYVRKRGTWRVEKFADDWSRSAKLALERKELPHYHVLRYEDLVTEPEREMRAVADFLGIEFQDSLLKPTRAGTVWGGNSMFGDNKGKIHAGTLGRYSEHLEPSLLEKLESYLYDEMQAWGYAPERASSTRQLPIGYRFDEWVHDLVWRLKTGFRVKLDRPGAAG